MIPYAIGDAEDEFVLSVFEKRLKNRFVFLSRELEAVRIQFAGLHNDTPGQPSTFDIIADAPAGYQMIGDCSLRRIFAGREDSNDDILIAMLRRRFSQCRLLGCVTAIGDDNIAFMCHLAKLLEMPVIGTLRAIAYKDFNEHAFVDHQYVSGEKQDIVLSTESLGDRCKIDDDTRNLIQSGSIQASWLQSFPQETFNPDDHSELPSAPPQFSLAEFWTPAVPALPTTGDIVTRPVGQVELEVDSGVIRADVLAAATLLRIRRADADPFYVNVPPGHPRRDALLLALS